MQTNKHSLIIYFRFTTSTTTCSFIQYFSIPSNALFKIYSNWSIVYLQLIPPSSWRYNLSPFWNFRFKFNFPTILIKWTQSKYSNERGMLRTKAPETAEIEQFIDLQIRTLNFWCKCNWMIIFKHFNSDITNMSLNNFWC